MTDTNTLITSTYPLLESLDETLRDLLREHVTDIKGSDVQMVSTPFVHHFAGLEEFEKSFEYAPVVYLAHHTVSSRYKQPINESLLAETLVTVESQILPAVRNLAHEMRAYSDQSASTLTPEELMRHQASIQKLHSAVSLCEELRRYHESYLTQKHGIGSQPSSRGKADNA